MTQEEDKFINSSFLDNNLSLEQKIALLDANKEDDNISDNNLSLEDTTEFMYWYEEDIVLDDNVSDLNLSITEMLVDANVSDNNLSIEDQIRLLDAAKTVVKFRLAKAAKDAVL